MPDLIAAMESALAKFSAREVLQPVRSVLTVGPTKAYFGLMPAYVPVAGEPRRQARDGVRREPQAHLPSHLATILLLDPETGALLAMMDGRYITEARTAAVSAVSTRFLGQADASTLAIIGSGVQARSHLEAYQHVRQLKEVRIWSPKQRSRQQFVDDMSGHVSDPDRRRRFRRSGGARRRPDRARDLVADAGDRRCVGVRGRARRVRRRLPAEPAGDAAGARQAQPPVCRFARRRRRSNPATS